MNKEKIAEIVKIIVEHRNDPGHWHMSEKYGKNSVIARKILALFPPDFRIEIDCEECGGLGWYEIGLHREGKCETCKGTGKVLSPLKADLVGTLKEGVE